LPHRGHTFNPSSSSTPQLTQIVMVFAI